MMASPWETKIADSAFFVCVVTPHYLTSPECWEQLAIARRLQKPCRAFIKHGTPIPKGFFDGFTDLRCFPFTTEADLAIQADRLVDEIGTGGTIIDGGVD